jgi:hypothetical protein
MISIFIADLHSTNAALRIQKGHLISMYKKILFGKKKRSVAEKRVP